MKYLPLCFCLCLWTLSAGNQTRAAQQASPAALPPETLEIIDPQVPPGQQKPQEKPKESVPTAKDAAVQPVKPTVPRPRTTPPRPSPTEAPPRPPESSVTAANPSTSGLTGETLDSASRSLMMLGDLFGIPAIAFGQRGAGPLPPGTFIPKGAILAPSLRSFKIGEDESPEPVDRAYFGFNYFNRANEAVNRSLGAGVHNIDVFRYTFGLEKTFLDRDASIGLRLPVNSLRDDGTIPGIGDASTAVGDLSVILKYAFWRNRDTGSLMSAGLGITTPTGPSNFAGVANVVEFHSVTLQPFLGYRYNWGDFYVHGFSSIDVPMDPNDVTMSYSDFGVGYHLYRSCTPNRIITGVVPTLEMHINTPVNHRGILGFTDPAGTPDIVDLTVGTTFELGKRSTLAFAWVTPITGPKPFDFELVAQFNYRFGRACR